jgi:hypothetical protein
VRGCVAHRIIINFNYNSMVLPASSYIINYVLEIAGLRLQDAASGSSPSKSDIRRPPRESAEYDEVFLKKSVNPESRKKAARRIVLKQ